MVVVQVARMGHGVGVRQAEQAVTCVLASGDRSCRRKTKGACFNTSLKQFYWVCLKRVFELHINVVYIFLRCVQQRPLIRNRLKRNFRLLGTGFHFPIFTKDLVKYTFIRNSSYKYNFIYFYGLYEFLISGFYCILFSIAL